MIADARWRHQRYSWRHLGTRPWMPHPRLAVAYASLGLGSVRRDRLTAGLYWRAVPSRFVVQYTMPRAFTTTRLQVGDVLRSWAVLPVADPAERRLRSRSATTSSPRKSPKAQSGQARGLGRITIWDEGHAAHPPQQRATCRLTRRIQAPRAFGLSYTRGRQWILVKALDDEARRGSDITAEQPTSVRSGRTWREMLD